MKAVGGLSYLALGGVVVPALLIAVSCGGYGGEPVATASPQVSPAVLLPTSTVPAGLWRPPAHLPSLPISESDALWREIWTSTVFMEPVLRPTYLPPSLVRVRPPPPGGYWYGSVSFTVPYSDSEDEEWLMLEAGGGGEKAYPPGSEEQVSVRDTLATYAPWDPEAPTGWLCWNEPGSWGAPGNSRQHVGYCITAEGFPKEELIRVADALRPVESLMAVPTRVPFLPVTESDSFWRQVTAAATSIDPILRPVYLPPSITQVWAPEVSTESFGVVFSDSTGQTEVSMAAGPLNPGLPSPNSLQETVEVRGLSATYQLQDKAEPLGSAYVVWEQPGRLGEPARPADPHLDHVTYMVGSTGLPREELLKVANSLEPVER